MSTHTLLQEALTLGIDALDALLEYSSDSVLLAESRTKLETAFQRLTPPVAWRNMSEGVYLLSLKGTKPANLTSPLYCFDEPVFCKERGFIQSETNHALLVEALKLGLEAMNVMRSQLPNIIFLKGTQMKLEVALTSLGCVSVWWDRSAGSFYAGDEAIPAYVKNTHVVSPLYSLYEQQATQK